MPKTQAPTSIVDLAEQAGRHYRSPYLARDDAADSGLRRSVPFVIFALCVAAAALVWRMVR